MQSCTTISMRFGTDAVETLIVVGGGLTAALIALANKNRTTPRRVVLVEDRHRFGGGPVQPFFADAMTTEGMALVADAVVREWPGYLVIEPAEHVGADPVITRIERSIFVLAPEQLHAELVTLVPPEDLHLHADIGPLAIGRTSVDLGSSNLAGDAVLDLRPLRRRSSAARIELELGSHLPEEGIALSLPVLADATIPGQAMMQYFPMDARWLIMRRARFLADGDPGTTRFTRGPAGGSDAVRRISFDYDAPSLPIPFPVPAALLPSEVPGAAALAIALARCPSVSPDSLGELVTTLAQTHRRAGASRAEALKLLARSADQYVPYHAVELADRL